MAGVTSAFNPRLERRGVRMSWRGVMPGGAGPQLPGDEFSATPTLWVKQRGLIPAGSRLRPQGKERRVPSQLCRSFSLLGRTCLAVPHRLGSPLLPEGFCLVRTFFFCVLTRYSLKLRAKRRPSRPSRRERAAHPGSAWHPSAAFRFVGEKCGTFCCASRRVRPPDQLCLQPAVRCQ